jgi:hypothetical protein
MSRKLLYMPANQTSWPFISPGTLIKKKAASL